MKKTSTNKLEAFEMWSLRRMMRIKKISYLGLILRGAKYEAPQLILQGKIEGRRGVGRIQLSWFRNIKEWRGIYNTSELCHAAKKRILIMS